MKTKTSKTNKTRKTTKTADTNKNTNHEETIMKTIDEIAKPTKSTQPALPAAADAPTPAPVVAATAPTPPAPPPATPVDGAIPTEQAVASAMDMLDQVIAVLGPYAAPQTTTQRRRSLKLRKGGEPIVGLLGGLATQYGVSLPGVDPVQMQANITLAMRLQPLDTKLRAASSLVSDTLRSVKSGAWQGTTALYTALTRASSQSPSLQTELGPAVAFFKKAPVGPNAPVKPKPSKKKLKEAQQVVARAGGATGAAGATPAGGAAAQQATTQIAAASGTAGK